MSTYDHQVSPAPCDIEVRNGAGYVRVTASDGPDYTVSVSALDARSESAAQDTTVSTSPEGRLVVDPPYGHRDSASLGIDITAPVGCDVRVSTGSADISLDGTFGSVRTNTGSGDVTAPGVLDTLDHRSGSGDISLGDVSGRCSATSASGDLRLRSAGSLTHEAASGDTTADRVERDLQVKTASGDVRIGSVGGGRIHITSASGDVLLGLAAGVNARLDVSTVSGDVDSNLDVTADPDTPADGSPGSEVSELHIRTISGDIELRHAEPGV